MRPRNDESIRARVCHGERKEGLHYTRDNPGEGHDERSEGLAKVAAG